jgi:flagellin-like hook-associated protein FlgL
VPTTVVLADTAGTAVGATIAEALVAATTELADLQTQFNELRTQLGELAEDSGYKGKNLLSATASLRQMIVQFEGNTLTVNGFDATASGLGVTAATWTAAGVIADDIVKLDTALDTLRQNASALAGNLSVITVRQDFSTNIVNTLIEGSDKLTLADSNEEGANMLMLQTRQTLSTTALSLSAQAAQSVLRLFQ